MRRKDKMISSEEAMSILEKGEHGILSTVSPDNEPYGMPLIYCLINNSIYFHCAVEGRKIDNIRHDARVSFCVVGSTKILPEKFGTLYESCIVYGLASEVFDEEKMSTAKTYFLCAPCNIANRHIPKINRPTYCG